MSKANVEVVTYSEKYLPAFVALNLEWIERHFAVEPMDIDQLNHPNEKILDIGGEIFFVVEDGHAVGTCALIPHGDGYELAKMAVAPEARGKGYGDLIMTFAINWARSRGRSHLMLLSNTILEPALTLYKKHGFRVVHLGPHPDYKRCNIEMSREL